MIIILSILRPVSLESLGTTGFLKEKRLRLMPYQNSIHEAVLLEKGKGKGLVEKKL